MDGILVDLGFIQIYWYSLTMLLGVIFGGLLTFLELKRLKINTSYFFDMIFWVKAMSIVLFKSSVNFQ